MAATIRRYLLPCFGVALLAAMAPVDAQTLENAALQRKQEDQQRARTMTRDLLGGVLDIQLRQLEENGLSDQEIFRDIKLMRQNLNQLVETEMSKVVDLLAEAQRLPKDQREPSFVEARQQIRTIVRQLSIERQNLLKRLKIAELAEQVRRLIRQQTVVQTATKGLSAEPQARQEALTLKSIEDQRDVKELFMHLVDTMVDMKSWSGMLAMAAADGLRILKTADVGKHLDEAGRQLKAVKYEPAYDEQEQVLKGLRELLKVIERAQGALNSESMASIDRVRALSDKQKMLREETKKFLPNQSPSAELVEQQSQLQKEIAQLQDIVRNNAKAETHIEQAETAAVEAAANLLEAKLEQAVADQGHVLGALAALELALKDQARQQSKDRSADELAAKVSELSQAKSALLEARKNQDAAEKQAEQNAQAAAAEEKHAAEKVEQAMDKFDLPSSIEVTMADAASATKEAAKNLESASSEKATPLEQKALDKASDALDRALATVDAALADAQRQQSAVKIGELARAAEVLERAAAEERAIAKDAMMLAEADAANPTESVEQAKELAERQGDIQTISDKAAQAIMHTAPEAAKAATEATKKVSESAADLQSIAELKSTDPKSTSEHAAETATTAAQKLTEAAKEIRKEILASAKDLSEKTAAQAQKLSEARAEVEKAVDLLPSDDKVAQLEAARDKLGQSMREQAKAQGQPQAAAAMELVNQISNALDAQDAANAAAAAAQSGLGTDLKATTQQEEVAEKSQSAADTAAKRPQAQNAKKEGKPDALADALNEARQAAAMAAKQTLDGNPSAAQGSRHVAESALKNAMQLAQAESIAAAKSAPTASPDKQAQANAAAAAEEAQTMAAKASPQAGADVAPASAATDAADQALANNPDQAPAAQAKAMDSLREADKKLDSAIKNALADRAKSLAHQASDSANLADRIASIDQGAADAVDIAADAAEMGAKAEDSSRQMTSAANAAELALEHAAADLGAKEQEIRRDQAIADAMANLAMEQQNAAEVIAAQSAELEKVAAAADHDPSAAERSAAQKLNEAQQQFAEAQRATGQGAVELSGQREVANLPLREALEIASNLPTDDYPNSAMLETAMDPTMTAEDGQPIPEGQPQTVDQAPPADTAANSTESEGQGRASGQTSEGAKNLSKPNSLGTGFVPQSPQLTAEMMAGSKAQQAAKRALSQQLPLPQQGSKSAPQTSNDVSQQQEGDAQPSESSDSSKLTKKDGVSMQNQKVKDGLPQKQREGTDAEAKTTSSGRGKEENAVARQMKEEAWFAKLSPELRKSIRTGVGQKPPRAYEERLKKYFQSVD